MRLQCGVRCWAGSWGRGPDQVRLATTPLGLSFSPGKVPSAAGGCCARPSLPDPPHSPFRSLAARMPAAAPGPPPHSGCLFLFRTQRSATTRPTTSPRSASSSTVCHARCCSSSRPTTCCGASRLPWAPAPAPALSSTCRDAASKHWPRECGLRPPPATPPQLPDPPQGSARLPFLLQPPGPGLSSPVSSSPCRKLGAETSSRELADTWGLCLRWSRRATSAG